MEHRLAAILSADVKGYSRLMGEDEEGTLRTFKDPTMWESELAALRASVRTEQLPNLLSSREMS